jgi:hypothetical protein
MKRPQQQELEMAVANFLKDSSGTLEVYLPEQSDPTAPVFDVGNGETVTFRRHPTPSIWVSRWETPDRESLARSLGFEIKKRTAHHPFKGALELSYAEKRFHDAEQGAEACLEWLQHAAKLGQSWLWITNLSYDEWPDPLPKPTRWPPNGY